MKKFLSYGLVIAALTGATPAQAWFDGVGRGGGSAPSTWSWSAIKQVVVTKVENFWHQYGQTSTASTQPAARNGSAAAAGTQAQSQGQTGGFWTVTSTKNEAPYKPVIPVEKSIKTAAPLVKAIRVSRVAKPGIPFHDKHLIMGHNHIPVFEFKKFRAHILATHVKRVPLLDVGEEPTLDQNAFNLVSIIPYPVVPLETHKALETPPVASESVVRQWVGAPVKPAPGPEKIVIPALEEEKKVTLEKIAKLNYDIAPDQQVNPLPVVQIADEDLKLLRGLILFEKKDQCHIATGIFSGLVDSTRPEIAESSRYHLGLCLHEMNLPTESLHYLKDVIRGKNLQHATAALKASLEDLQLQHEDELAEAVNQMDPQAITEDLLPQVNYLKAKYFLKKGHANKALEAALKVPAKSPFYFKAQYVAAVAEYELGRVDASIDRQKAAAAELASRGSDANVLALFEVNLGRSAFERGRYKEALDAYQRVPKESPMWLQALTEMGWVQLQSKDTSGAIGNMHSIQSPYFEGVFKPESYVIRAIGYLNICQYGDAYKSLGYLDYKYSPWLAKIEAYNKTHNGAQTYASVLKMLQTKGNQDVDGVPFQALKDAAHHRDFLNAQEAVNQLIDEKSGYPFIRGLILKDRRALMARRNATINKVAELNSKIKRARTTPGAMRNYNAWRFELNNYLDFLSVYEFKVQTINEGLAGLEHMTPKAQERIAAREVKLKEDAGRVLHTHMLKLAKDLHQALENNELVKYEVFADSGENLRYQMAGGKVGGDSKNSVKRSPSGMHWDFDGEFWEDEIGHYRSSLKNNCQSLQYVGKKKGN